MNKRLLAVAVLLLAALLWWRLDVDALHAAIEQQTARLQGADLQAKGVSLSLMHGIGLRLDTVTFHAPRLSMQAGHVDISIHLLPLLFGKIEMGTLDIHDAHVKLDGDTLAALSVSFASLPFERVHMNRATIDDADGHAQLENLQLDVRNIGSDREALWELSARQSGYALQGHGQLAFRAGAVMSGFGKLKLKSIPASLLTTVAPAMLTQWLSHQNQRLTGGLTLDITRHHGWSLFGEVEAQAGDATDGDDQQPVRLRGKISHPAAGELVWHDSFIHLQDRAVIALDGHCLSGKCESRMDARNVPVGAWFKLLPKTVALPRTLAGNTRLTAMLRWQGDIWQASGSLGLNQLSFHHGQQRLSLPAMRLAVSDLHGNKEGWRGQARVSFPHPGGEIRLQAKSGGYAGTQRQTEGWQLKLEPEELADGVWQPLGNLLLSCLKLSPELAGSGPLRAEVVLQQQPDHALLLLDFDTVDATVRYGKQWLKPGGLAGRCRTSIGWDAVISQPKSMQLDQCVLGQSQLAYLEYHQGQYTDRVQFSGLQLDLNSLNDKQLALPVWLQLYRGRIEGEGELGWKHDTGALADATGQWNLQQLGTPEWQLSGSLSARDGVMNSSHLQVSGSLGQAEFKGSFRLPTHRGWVDVLSGHLDWQAMPALPALWPDLHLNGKLYRMHVSIAGYQWQDIEADYRFVDGKFKLEHGKVGFAGGELETDGLLLAAAEGTLRIDGKIRARDLQLEQMPWLHQWLQAGMTGKAQANIELKGVLPATDLADWRRSNGDVTIYSGSWTPQQAAPNEGDKPAANNSTPLAEFRKLAFRFRVQEQFSEISGINLLSHGNRYRGSALIATTDGAISGVLSGKSSHVIDGTWPYPHWQSQ